MFLERVCPEPQPVDPCDGLRTFSAHVAHIGTAAAGLRHSRAPERRRFLHMIVERRAGLRRHLLEWMGRKGGIPMGEDCVAAEPRQICSRLLPGRHFVFAFMEWSVRRGKPYELARLVGVALRHSRRLRGPAEVRVGPLWCRPLRKTSFQRLSAGESAIPHLSQLCERTGRAQWVRHELETVRVLRRPRHGCLDYLGAGLTFVNPTLSSRSMKRGSSCSPSHQ